MNQCVKQKGWAFCFQGEGHREGSCNQNAVCIIFSELLIVLQPNLVLMIHHYTSECLVKRLGLLYLQSCQDHSKGSKHCEMFVSPILFCTTNFVAIKLGVLMYCYWLTRTNANKVGVYPDNNTVTYTVTGSIITLCICCAR